MPRKARIDAPGALHNIIIRGIECKAIFKDDADRAKFVARIGQIMAETETDCFVISRYEIWDINVPMFPKYWASGQLR